ncbi:hypothetical protein BDV38DRAFT_253996 [Aspergillus pseudotamarii]|uniref:Uncharacterized protein n=1 Tax=Aspergillus pseudotamarii TaxID=132259 RepID=A0A5N6SJM5_ASPPS|nr:uncharacterized protein BDV38DRAFT_253996 [Aspergillus pseudotamarii]KAE8134898.1 hypothetical protein BDV38DRAFT_253996 [Aspergillus pseudotamarii]
MWNGADGPAEIFAIFKLGLIIGNHFRSFTQCFRRPAIVFICAHIAGTLVALPPPVTRYLFCDLLYSISPVSSISY